MKISHRFCSETIQATLGRDNWWTNNRKCARAWCKREQTRLMIFATAVRCRDINHKCVIICLLVQRITLMHKIIADTSDFWCGSHNNIRKHSSSGEARWWDALKWCTAIITTKWANAWAKKNGEKSLIICCARENYVPKFSILTGMSKSQPAKWCRFGGLSVEMCARTKWVAARAMMCRWQRRKRQQNKYLIKNVAKLLTCPWRRKIPGIFRAIEMKVHGDVHLMWWNWKDLPSEIKRGMRSFSWKAGWNQR